MTSSFRDMRDVLPELSRIVSEATTSRTSNFYRRHYGLTLKDPPVRIEDDISWRRIPYLTKGDLLSCELEQRLFHPLSEAGTIFASSGTSGKPPLFSPSSASAQEVARYRKDFHDFPGGFLSCGMRAAHEDEEILSLLGSPGTVITFDVSHPGVSAYLAMVAEVDSIHTSVFLIERIGQEFLRRGIAGQIRYIELAGERCSASLLAEVRRIFPNAAVVIRYGSYDIETSIIGVPCRIEPSEAPGEMHFASNIFVELIDVVTEKPLPLTPDAEGELVVTTLAARAFPSIRYRTGDIVRVGIICEKHGLPFFSVQGRRELDFIKIAGGMLRADEIERVLKYFSDRVSDRFELRYKEIAGGAAHITLLLEPKRPIDWGDIAHEIANVLRIHPSLTYAEAAAAGTLHELQCGQLQQGEQAQKRRRFVRV